MRLALKLHPDCTCASVRRLEVEVARPRRGSLTLHFLLTGAIGDLRIPPAAAPAFEDELWKHTCFEAFLRAPASAPYYEFNFAPSLRWAAYGFSGYRSGMRPIRQLSRLQLEARSGDDWLELRASLELDLLPDLPADAPWRLGVSAVIEEKSGSKSYWALAHPPGSPDFHHQDCFAHQLPEM